MRTLKAVALLPFFTVGGAVVTSPGYHAETQVGAFFDVDELGGVHETPDRDQLVAALVALWRPWSAFRFAGPDDRGAMLATILGAIARPGLNTCPATIFDAPVQGSGKTRAAEAVATLMRGSRGVMPFAGGAHFEQELSKKLVSLTLNGSSCVVLDNIVGHLDSAVLAGFLTSGVLEDRILGGNTFFRGEARMMLMATSNNCSLQRDLSRRFLKVRIDTGVAQPQRQTFEFCPVTRAMTERLAIARGVLTLVSGFFAAGSPRLGKEDCGFADWNRLIRSCVLWASREGLGEAAGIGVLGDPAAGLLGNDGAMDPESESLGMLLVALHKHFGTDPFTVRELRNIYMGDGEIREAVDSLPGVGRDPNSTKLGYLLRHRRDRIENGLKLVGGGKSRDGIWWSVRMAE